MFTCSPLMFIKQQSCGQRQNTYKIPCKINAFNPFFEIMILLLCLKTYFMYNNVIIISKLLIMVFSTQKFTKLYLRKYFWIELRLINPLYNHTHFIHILVYVTNFLVTICFSKKHYSLESLSHLLVAQNICKVFFRKCDYNGGNLGNILEFVNCSLLAFLVLFCVQVVQTNNNESI
jgi:hypothetical protein